LAKLARQIPVGTNPAQMRETISKFREKRQKAVSLHD
jgi:hypothetical protein